MDDINEAYHDLCEAQAWLNELLDTENAALDDIAEARRSVEQSRTRYRRAIGAEDMDTTSEV